MKMVGRTAANVAFFDAYRGGQLGYIALGWIAGAMADLIKAMTSGPGPINGWLVLWFAGLAIATLVSAVLAGVGTIPVIPTAPAQSPGPVLPARLAVQQLQAAATAAEQEALLQGLQRQEAIDVLRAALEQRTGEAQYAAQQQSNALQKDVVMFKLSFGMCVIALAMAIGVHVTIS
jgi:hypothetical protein